MFSEWNSAQRPSCARDLDGAPADDPRASPLYADLSGLPPILMQAGSTELLLDDARRVHEAVIAAGGSSRLTIYEDVMHGWHLLAPLLPEARIALREVATFVRTHLARSEVVARPGQERRSVGDMDWTIIEDDGSTANLRPRANLADQRGSES